MLQRLQAQKIPATSVEPWPRGWRVWLDVKKLPSSQAGMAAKVARAGYQLMLVGCFIEGRMERYYIVIDEQRDTSRE